MSVLLATCFLTFCCVIDPYSLFKFLIFLNSSIYIYIYIYADLDSRLTAAGPITIICLMLFGN